MSSAPAKQPGSGGGGNKKKKRQGNTQGHGSSKPAASANAKPTATVSDAPLPKDTADAPITQENLVTTPPPVDDNLVRATMPGPTALVTR